MTREQMLAIGAPDLPAGYFYRIRKSRSVERDISDWTLEIRKAREGKKRRWQEDSVVVVSDSIYRARSIVDTPEDAIKRSAEDAWGRIEEGVKKNKFAEGIAQFFGDHH